MSTRLYPTCRRVTINGRHAFRPVVLIRRDGDFAGSKASPYTFSDRSDAESYAREAARIALHPVAAAVNLFAYAACASVAVVGIGFAVIALGV